MIKSVQVVSTFEQWGWPQAIAAVGIAFAIATAIGFIFHFFSKM